ncbi:MAG: gfo/Idh/MocA family oxidoreductase, partial [Mariniphaga sp.]|nr:gfo/Idh/MocA family oxidoreductase [Mariniphaga sp.]
GYNDMFTDMFNSMENGSKPTEDFYDGYVVNAIMDACYKSAKTKKWEPVELREWNGLEEVELLTAFVDYDEENYLVKEEVLPDGREKVILKNKASGEIYQRVDPV